MHQDTRVIAAINFGSEYDVNEMDPALLRRFWVADIEPSTEDWLSWAGDHDIDPVLMDFIRQNPAHLRVDPSTVEPGTVCPNPASWDRLNQALVHMNMQPTAIAGSPRPAGVYALSMGMVGTEAAIAFCAFMENYARQISAEDVLAGKVTKEVIEKAQASMMNSVIAKVSEHSKNNVWTGKQAKAVAAFMEDLPGEMMVDQWNKITESQNIKNIQVMHKLIGTKIVEAVKQSRQLN